MSDSLVECLRLVSVLNAMSVRGWQAHQAEQVIRTSAGGDPDIAHHVADTDGVLGMAPDLGHPIRIVFAQVAKSMPNERWALLVVRPGNLGGLRGPMTTNQLAMECGVAVMARGGGLAWLPRPVGPAMQWQLVNAERPLMPPVPAESSRQLNEAILEAARELATIGVTAGTRPDDAASVVLGEAYPPANQRLLDKAMLWREACARGLAASSEMLDSFAVVKREKYLRQLDDICCDAISSASSWTL